MAIHGNKSQTARTKALADFKKGDLQVLVATDIAARGIDIDQLPHVVNFELPNVPEDYVHRIGRTGRAGAKGEAISLVCVDENGFLRDIERLTKHEIPKEIVPGFAPPAHERPEPIVLGRMVIGEGAGRGGMRRSSGGPARRFARRLRRQRQQPEQRRPRRQRRPCRQRRRHGGGNGGGSNGGHAGGSHRQAPPRPQGPSRDGRSSGGGGGRPPARLLAPKR